jgi:hypothetical protein
MRTRPCPSVYQGCESCQYISCVQTRETDLLVCPVHVRAHSTVLDVQVSTRKGEGSCFSPSKYILVLRPSVPPSLSDSPPDPKRLTRLPHEITMPMVTLLL